MTDWTRSGALAVYTWRAVAPGAGVGGNARQMRRITQEEEVTREVIGTRCERGAQIARMLELPEDTAQAIRALDEHWDGSGHPLGLRGEEIRLFARILCLAQTVEVFVRSTCATTARSGRRSRTPRARRRWPRGSPPSGC